MSGTRSITAIAADMHPLSSDHTHTDSMAPLTLAQDRLARGQNPSTHSTSGSWNPHTDPSRSDGKSPVKTRVPKGPPGHLEVGREQSEPDKESMQNAKKNEMWEESQQRHKAAVILGSWEMVTWYGIAGDESNPQTALRLKRMMIGLKDSPGSDQWEDERNPGDEDAGPGSGKNVGSSPQSKGGSKRKH